MSIFKRPDRMTEDARDAPVYGVVIDPAVMTAGAAISEELKKARESMSAMMAMDGSVVGLPGPRGDSLATAMMREEERMRSMRYGRDQIETLAAQVTVSRLELMKDERAAKHGAVLKALRQIATELYKFADIEMVPSPRTDETEIFVSVRVALPKSGRHGYVDPTAMVSLAEMQRDNDQFRREYLAEFPKDEPMPIKPSKPKRTPLEEAFDQLAQVQE